MRIYDPCYAATAVLSESFLDPKDKKLTQWLEIYKNIIEGYDSVIKLSTEESKAIPYVILSNQLICVTWFSEQEKYQEIYQVNKAMTDWIVNNFDKLQI